MWRETGRPSRYVYLKSAMNPKSMCRLLGSGTELRIRAGSQHPEIGRSTQASRLELQAKLGWRNRTAHLRNRGLRRVGCVALDDAAAVAGRESRSNSYFIRAPAERTTTQLPPRLSRRSIQTKSPLVSFPSRVRFSETLP